jgi:hypothetical protein
VAVMALRDQLDTFWNRALSGYQDMVEKPSKDNRNRREADRAR